LGEHLLCTQEVIGSIPFTSTSHKLEVEKSRPINNKVKRFFGFEF
jgi:hypothetical protein